MTPQTLLATAVLPALAMLPLHMRAREAMAMLVAIALQESGLRHRVQVGGPARGFWQFERSGVEGVLRHHTTDDTSQGFVRALLHPVDSVRLYESIRDADVLAAGLARLYLWQYPGPLPRLDSDPGESWEQYVGTWRPGKPHRERWDENWAAAVDAVKDIAA